jgi:hypothetical protein
VPQKEYQAEASQNTWAQHGSNKRSGTSGGVGDAAEPQNGFTIESPQNTSSTRASDLENKV